MSYAGSCLCGGIRYRTENLSQFGFCHCESCRKASGAAFGANSGVDRADLEVEDPEGLLTEYESSPGKIRAFCGRCGSPMFAWLTATPHLVRIRLGSLDTPLDDAPRAHSFVSEKADWLTLDDGVPQFETWADPEVLVQVGSRQSQQ